MNLLKSKRFRAALIALLVAVVGHFGWDLDEVTIGVLMTPLLAYIAGQSVSDYAKEKVGGTSLITYIAGQSVKEKANGPR